MNILEINKIFEFVSASLLILFAVFIFTQKRGNKLVRLFLGLFLLNRALILICFAFWKYENLVYSIPDFIILGEPLLYLYAPLLFLYTYVVTKNYKKIRAFHFLHFLPFILNWFFLALSFHSKSLNLKSQLILNGDWYHHIYTNENWLWLQFVIYAVACVYLLGKYQQSLKMQLSTYNRNKLNWLNFLIGAFLVWKAIFISGYLTGILSGNYQLYFRFFIELTFLIYASIIVYKGLQMPNVVLHIENEKMYNTSPLSIDDKKQYIEIIEKIMQNDKPYLKSDFTLKELAEKCNIPIHFISQVINENLNQNFYNFINNYRIEEAKRILSDPTKKTLTILEVLYEVGFNSKSVFNTAFKKYVKMTPTNYKKSQLKIA
jgi:AraC-like DNA-binding protein